MVTDRKRATVICATAWFAVWLMATAGALAWLVVLAAYNVTNGFRVILEVTRC